LTAIDLDESEPTGPGPGPRPKTHNGNLADLPPPLRPLIERDQWAIWRWTVQGGKWQKPPFQVRDPDKHVSTADPSTWATYNASALAVAAGIGGCDGITFIQTVDCGLASIDFDHCVDAATGVPSLWLQTWLVRAKKAKVYVEITPSGEGVRIWGRSQGARLHTRIELAFGPEAAVEIFRSTAKALTVTGLQLDVCTELGSIDKLIDQVHTWANRKEHKRERKPLRPVNGGDGGDGQASPGVVANLSDEEIERVIQHGVLDPSWNRSDVFHGIIECPRRSRLPLLRLAANFCLAECPKQSGRRHRHRGPLARNFVLKHLRRKWKTKAPGVGRWLKWYRLKRTCR
jgi:hypothetical protein